MVSYLPFLIYIVFTCDIASFCESRGSPACCFLRNSTWRKKTNKHLSVLSHHSLDKPLLWTSPLMFPLSHLAVIWESTFHCICMCVQVWMRTFVCACVYTLACMHVPVCIVCMCAYMCQKLDMILSPAKALDHPALLTPDLTVQLN